MIFKCVVVFDRKAESYETPRFVRGTGEAVRIFQDLVNDGGKSIFSVHPIDFVLFEIGEFDERTGLLDLYSDFKRLGSGDDFVIAAKAIVSHEEK